MQRYSPLDVYCSFDPRVHSVTTSLPPHIAPAPLKRATKMSLDVRRKCKQLAAAVVSDAAVGISISARQVVNTRRSMNPLYWYARDDVRRYIYR